MNRLTPKDACAILVKNGFPPETNKLKNVVFFRSGYGLRAGLNVDRIGAPHLMQVVLRTDSCDIFSSTNKARAKKTVSYRELFSLLVVWGKDGTFSKQKIIGSRAVPELNWKFVLKMWTRIATAGGSRKPLQKYLTRFIFEEAWNPEVKVNVVNMQFLSLFLPCNVVRPDARIVWKNDGFRGTFMALGATEAQLRTMGGVPSEQVGDHAFTVSFEKPPIDIHGGMCQGVLFFGWRCSVAELLQACPASINVSQACIIKGVAYVSDFRTLSERLLANVFVQLESRWPVVLAKATRSEKRALDDEKRKEEARKRARTALEVGTCPPCIDGPLHRLHGEHPKHSLRWKMFAVLRAVCLGANMVITDILNVVEVQRAWASLPKDTQREMQYGLGIQGNTPSKVYSVTCGMMDKEGACPYSGDTSRCGDGRGNGPGTLVVDKYLKEK